LTAGARLIGEDNRSSILYYTGTDAAVRIDNVNCAVENLLITSLDPTTSNFLISSNAGTGSASTGILIKHVDAIIRDNVICYFNDASLKSAGIKTDGSTCFSNYIGNNYIRYCWGGVSLEDTVTDTTVIDNTILDTEKYGISVGYDWNAAAQTSFTGDNIRLQNNLINTVCRNYSPGGGVGSGYGVYLSRSAGIQVASNYIEDYYAESGFTAYGIYIDGTSGDRLLNTTISGNNTTTAFSGTKYSLYVSNAWYGNVFGNHFEGNASTVTTTSTSRYFLFGSNFFTGSPSNGYSLQGQQNYAYDLPNNDYVFSDNLSFNKRLGNLTLSLKSLDSGTSLTRLDFYGYRSDADTGTVSDLRVFNSQSGVQFFGTTVVGEGSAGNSRVKWGTAASGTFNTKLELTSAGIFMAGTDNTQQLGASFRRWSEVFAGAPAINTSDAREKQQVRDLLDAERAVAMKIKSLLKAFKFNHAVEQKGDGARIHFGVLAQYVAAAFASEGLDAAQYALFCHDSWEEQPEVTEPILDDDGNLTGEYKVVQEYMSAGDRYGIRYEELLAFIIAAL
jgi:hypothetical protein